MIDDVEQYPDDGRHGEASRDPKARAHFVAMAGGGFLLYLKIHEDPSRRVLPEYSQDMVLPAFEPNPHGLMADSTRYDAFLTQQGNGDDGSDEQVPATA